MFQHPITILVQNIHFIDIYCIANDILISKGTDFASPHRTKRCEQDCDFEFFPLNMLEQALHICIRWSV